MKTIVFGQIGLRKKRFLPQVEGLAQSKGQTLKVFNVGEMMYACDPRIVRGRILQKKVMELDNIRARVFDDIRAQIAGDNSCDNFCLPGFMLFQVCFENQSHIFTLAKG